MNRPNIQTGHVGWSPDYQSRKPLAKEPPKSGSDQRLVRRYHGWHWWLGIANEVDCNGKPLVVPRWYAVHCWTADGVLMALSAHWSAPMRQEEMRGQWGPEIIPPNK